MTREIPFNGEDKIVMVYLICKKEIDAEIIIQSTNRGTVCFVKVMPSSLRISYRKLFIGNHEYSVQQCYYLS